MHKILRTLSQKYNMTLENINEDNRCYIAGSNIFIGKYKDSELLLISFFHEIGHRLIKNQFIKKESRSEMRPLRQLLPPVQFRSLPIALPGSSLLLPWLTFIKPRIAL